jgi:hypothetical protein
MNTIRINELKIKGKRLTLATFGIAAFILVFWYLFFSEKDNHLNFVVDHKIDVTPEQIQSIKAIGEWEFLSVSCEELVDTIRKGIFSDDHLVRIYFGTMRLGINLHQVKPGWMHVDGDSIEVTLPPVGLLDRDFIDEARTKAFYESGKWTAKDREALYQKAYRQMLSHGLTQQNMENARLNAKTQFRRMMQAMGYNYVSIRFEE